MTQQQVIGIVQLETKENARAAIPFSLSYTFDYDRFTKPDLQTKAKSTLGDFFGFVRQTFDGLIEIGR